MYFKNFITSILCLLFFIGYSIVYCQVNDSRYAIGLGFGLGNEIKNTDYTYTNHYVKGQFYYSLKQTNDFEFQIVLEPEINFATHQLLNLYFITPDDPDFEEKRTKFTKLKNIRELVLHCGLLIRKPLSEKLSVYVLGSVGPVFTDTETERLSKGFAFSDVIGLGISYKIKKLILDFRPNFRHNSNAGLQNSNAGFNTLNYDFGIIFPL